MSNILCIDTEQIGRDTALQKSIKLEDVLLNHTDYFSSKKLDDEAFKRSKWKPLKFATTVRSIGTNKVLCCDIKDENRTVFYHTFGSVDKFIHKGYDLVMFLSSMSIMNILSEKADKTKLNDVMFNGSIFKCMGIFYNAEIVDPIIYSIVYIQDNYFDDFFRGDVLKDDWRVEDISVMKEDTHGNIKALVDEIKIVEVDDGYFS